MAVLMMFGTAPIFGIGMLTMAAGGLETISVLPGSLSMKRHDTYQFRVGGRDKNGNVYPLDESAVSWGVSNTDYASITSDGQVTVFDSAPLGATFLVSAIYSVGNKNYKNDATVTIVDDSSSVAKSIGVEPAALSLSVGQQFQLTVLGYTEENQAGSAFEIASGDVIWNSANSDYVTVTSAGVVKAVKSTKIGDTNNGVEITISLKSNLNINKKIRVYVDDTTVALNGISIVPASIEIEEGADPVQLQAVGHGTDGKDYPLVASDVLWSVTDTTYIKVTSGGEKSGELTALKYSGEINNLYVKAFYTDSAGVTHSANCSVKVLKKATPVTKLVVTPTDTVIGVGDTVQMQATGLNGMELVPLDSDKLTWGSDDTKVVSITNTGLATALKATGAEGVKVRAFYVNGSTAAAGEATIIVRQRVDEIRWKWDANALLAGETYYYGDKYEVFPATAENKDVTLSVSDTTMIDINAAEKTFTVREFPGNAEYKAIDLTLTAVDPSSQCKPVSKQMFVYNDVPLKGVYWDLNVNPNNNTAQFSFYENAAKEAEGVAAEYWYEPTKTNELGKYKYHTDPTYARTLCDITITSSDERVMKIEKETKRLIPVGNGTAVLTITAKTKKGVTKSDTVKVKVVGSHYTPITGATIGINEKKSGSSYTVMSKSKVRLGHTTSMVLGPMLPEGAQGTFDHETFEIVLENGKTFTVYEAADIKWTSSDTDAITVDKDGKVTAVGPGDAKITMTIKDNGAAPITASITVETNFGPFQALAGFFMSLVKFNFKMAGKYLKAFFSGIFGSGAKFFG